MSKPLSTKAIASTKTPSSTSTPLASAAASTSPTSSLSRRSIITTFPLTPSPSKNIPQQQIHLQSSQFRSFLTATTTPIIIPKSRHNKRQAGPYQHKFAPMATIGKTKVDGEGDKAAKKKAIVAAQKKNKADLEAAGKKKLKLQKFWSTNTPERTTKFKQIVLQREIGLDDFQAIFSNSTFVHKEHMHCPGGKEDTEVDFKMTHFPWHLSLDTPASPLGMGPTYFGKISARLARFPYGSRESGNQIETLIDDEVLFELSRHDGDFSSTFSRKALDNLRIKLTTRKNPSPIKKINIKTITADNIDNIDGLLEKVNIYDLIPKGKVLSYLFSHNNIPEMWHNWGRFDWEVFLKTTKRKYAYDILLAGTADGKLTLDDLSHPEWATLDDLMEESDNFVNVYDVETEEFRWDDVGANSKYDKVYSSKY